VQGNQGRQTQSKQDRAGNRADLRKMGKGSGLGLGMDRGGFRADHGEDSGQIADSVQADQASMRVPEVRPADYVSAAWGSGRVQGRAGVLAHLVGGVVVGCRAGADGSGAIPPPPAPIDPPRPHPGGAGKFFSIYSPPCKHDWHFSRNLLAGTDPA
jgi:hypothetical protein